MQVERIIWISPTERDDRNGGLSHVWVSQVRNLINLLKIDSPLVWRTQKDFLQTENIAEILNKSKRTVGDDGESYLLDKNQLSDSRNIEEIIASTIKWKTVVVSTSQDELKKITEDLTNNWYAGVASKESTYLAYNVYALSINLETKESEFFTAPYWQ